jgi:CDGSH-type Zn-finger protein
VNAAAGFQAKNTEIQMTVEIVAKPNGPYQVKGDLSTLELRDGAGNLYDLTGKKSVFLCRCGASTTKPFCDGQHTKIGFQAAEQAVAAEG